MNPIADAMATMRREKIPRLVVRVVIAASLDVPSPGVFGAMASTPISQGCCPPP
jgi:hypothetical protein